MKKRNKWLKVATFLLAVAPIMMGFKFMLLGEPELPTKFKK